ncbi:serine/threonine protein kinase [Nannocystis pusilla]|uniref:serine/threonine protein kinase n=1 Tax=Nannocystis pusilla TaxID=889268 RepID=UPI003DA5A05A
MAKVAPRGGEHARRWHSMDKPERLRLWSTPVGASIPLSPQIGERFAGRYELKSPLRRDGAVHAFLALDHHSGIDVGLFLLDSACSHPTAWAAFARIVAAAAAGKIAGLVLPQGLGSAPPVPPFYLAEPQVLRGFDRLRDEGPMPWQRALTLGERAAEILHAAHVATGVGHRVLTPSRCAVTVRDNVKVLDFGVAELELGHPLESGYRAPEQQQGSGDARSDVYTLAVILFELISGQKSAGKPPPRLRSLIAVPRPVDEFMAKALAQEPAQRPDLVTMRASLRELLGAGAAPAEATPTAAPRLGPNSGISPVSIVSAPPGASVAPPATTLASSGSAVRTGPTPANAATLSAQPTTPSAASSAAPLPPRPAAVLPRPTPAVTLRSGLPALPQLQESNEAGMLVQGLEGETEELGVLHRPAPVVAEQTEVLVVVPRAKPEAFERAEVVRPDIAIVRDGKTAPKKPLRGPLAALALTRANADAADPVAIPLEAASDDSPTEKIAKPFSVQRTVLEADPPTERALRFASPTDDSATLVNIRQSGATEPVPSEKTEVFGQLGAAPVRLDSLITERTEVVPTISRSGPASSALGDGTEVTLPMLQVPGTPSRVHRAKETGPTDSTLVLEARPKPGHQLWSTKQMLVVINLILMTLILIGLAVRGCT